MCQSKDKDIETTPYHNGTKARVEIVEFDPYTVPASIPTSYLPTPPF